MPSYVCEPLEPGSDSWRAARVARPASLQATGYFDELEGAATEAGGQLSLDDAVGAGSARSDARRDRDRILYSSAFARLSGVTQVITPSPAGRQTNTRLTHSLKVAQVARSIAEQLNDDHRALQVAALGGADPDVAEAAALAHDLGHPPFGHIGEIVLDDFARRQLNLPQGFEGNAQSFRIVTLLEVHDLDGAGLALTKGTLAAVLKYPWSRRVKSDNFPRGRDEFDLPISDLREKKFCFYEDGLEAAPASWERQLFSDVMSLVPRDQQGRPVQSVEASIMDVADDITYALHDLDDFYRAGMIRRSLLLNVLEDWSVSSSTASQRSIAPRSGAVLSKLATRLAKSYPTRYDYPTMTAAVERIKVRLTALDEHFTGTREEIVRVQSMVSELITSFLQNLEIAAGPSWSRPLVSLASEDWHTVEILKELTRHFVINRPGLASVQRGQATLLRGLLERVDSWLVEEDNERVPPALRGFVQIAEAAGYGRTFARSRGVVDYVASLTDLQAIELHRILTGGHVDLSGGLLG